MSSKILSAAVVGLSAEFVEVEADTGGGELGSFSVVGLPDLAVSESRERVRSAIRNSGLEFPKVKVTVNLAPADLKKHGPSYDLPIAISVLAATGKIPPIEKNSLFVGELALDGQLRNINGLLPIALKAGSRPGLSLYVPEANSYEAGLVPETKVYPVKSLRDFINHIRGITPLKPLAPIKIDLSNQASHFDMSHIKGQEHVKRAMEIAAAGAHNMLMSGPPGSGKTLIARTMPSILPDLTLGEALELTSIYSIAGALKTGQSLVSSRPFRSPHHSSSGVALVGGGTWPRPGEISLSHRGVLFLDEFSEFPRSVLENLRQPLEDGTVQISRAAGTISFPAKFILIAATNPCPCGFLSDPGRECTCTPGQLIGYRKKISGPIIDRIDLHAEVPRINFDKLTSDLNGESSRLIKERVESARARQRQRFKKENIITNSEMGAEAVRRYCRVGDDSYKLLKEAVEKLRLSARSYFRILKISRTIADLSGHNDILTEHIAEALRFRPGI